MAINNNIDIVVKAIDKATKPLKGISKGFSSLSDKLEKNTETFEKMAGVGAAAFAGLTFGVNKTINSAVDLGESINAVSVVFGEGADRITEYGKTAAKTVGLSNRAFNQLSTETGTLLKATGKNIGDVADDTVMLAERAADLASVFNTDVEQAMSAINQALRGETEAIRQFGSDVTDASLDQYLLANGINKATKDMTQQEKTLYRMEKIMADTAQVQGDFVNTSDSLANKQRILASETENASAKFGELFIPMKQVLVDALFPLVEKISEFTQKNPELTKTIVVVTASVAGLAAVFGTLGLVLPAIITGFTTMITVVKSLGVALRFLALNPIGLVITAIAAGISIGIAIVENWDTIKAKGIELGGKLLELYEKYKILFSIFTPLIAIGIELYKNWDTIKIYAIALWETIKIVAKNIYDAWANAGTNIKYSTIQLKKDLSEIWDNIKEAIFGIVTNIVDTVVDKFNYLKDTVTGVFDKITGIYNKAKDLANKAANLVGLGGDEESSETVEGQRALGGTVQGGKTYLVGERGPELFTPSTTGSITPNNQIGGGVNVSINMGGVTVKSEADENRLAKRIQNDIIEVLQQNKFGVS